MRRSTAIILLLVLPLAACHKWVPPETGPDVSHDDPESYERIRVRTSGDSTLVLYQAELRADSLVGHDHTSGTSTKPLRVALPRHDIESLEVRRTDVGATVLTVLGVSAGLIIGAGLVCAATDCYDPVGW